MITGSGGMGAMKADKVPFCSLAIARLGFVAFAFQGARLGASFVLMYFRVSNNTNSS